MKNKFYDEILYKLSSIINELEIESNYSSQLIEALINHVLLSLVELRAYVQKNGFKSTGEEIHFFKHQKPMVVSKLIYYNAIYKIENGKPQGTKLIEEYLNDELIKLKKYFWHC